MDAIAILKEKGVKPTSNRIELLQVILATPNPISFPELEIIMENMDKSSIFRALNTFREHHVVHTLEDGSDSLKYEVCKAGKECTVSNMHTHFYCENCQRTFCFDDIQIPIIGVPDGFIISSINYMVKGTCPDCVALDCKPTK